MEVTAMPNRRYISGVRLEREIRQILEERYNIPCLRTAGSKSDFDLIALGKRTLLIQVKYTSKKNIKLSRTYIRKFYRYTTPNRWVAIVVVRRQTRLTNLVWIIDEPYWYDYYGLCSHDSMAVKFPDAMNKLYQLCSGHEINNQ